MVRMEDEDLVHGAGKDRVDVIILSRHGKAHMEEILRIGQVIPRIIEWLAERIFIGHRRKGRNFRNQAPRGDCPLRRVLNIGRVVIEGRQRANDATHDGHRVGITAEPAIEDRQLLMNHRVAGDGVVEFGLLLGIRQFAFQQEIGHFKEVGLVGKRFDRIAAMQQDALVTIDIGQAGFAGSCRPVAGVEGKHACFAIELADIQNIGTDTAVDDRQFNAAAALIVGQRHCFPGVGIRSHRHSPLTGKDA